MSIQLRTLTPQDTVAAASIFFAAVHEGTADVYSQEQRRAWAGDQPAPQVWQHRFDTMDGVAATKGNAMVGFMTIDAKGYIDLAFVHPDYMGTGIGRVVYHAIEDRARALGVRQLTTYASEKAKPFFCRMGWSVEAPNTVTKGAVTLRNYKMFKALPGGPA